MIILKIGEIFRSKLTGKDYELRKITGNGVLLHSLDGLSQILTWEDNLNFFYEKVPNQERLKGKVI